MAFYDYACDACGHVFEVKHGMAETPLVACEKCSKTCRKLITIDFGIGGEREISEYNDVGKARPKWLRFKDGHRERFNPLKHGTGGKGSESRVGKPKKKKPS